MFYLYFLLNILQYIETKTYISKQVIIIVLLLLAWNKIKKFLPKKYKNINYEHERVKLRFQQECINIENTLREKYLNEYHENTHKLENIYKKQSDMLLRDIYGTLENVFKNLRKEHNN
jgi:hypothetical protein